MIEKRFLFPECYVAKVPFCDDCKVQLSQSGVQVLTNPVKLQYICSKCHKEYYFLESEVQGEWKWRML